MKTLDVGRAIEDAIMRGAQQEGFAREYGRKLSVRFRCTFDGLEIHAYFAARAGSELDAQQGLGRRVIPWVALDHRADELVAFVDQVVQEVEGALGEMARA